MSKPADIDAAVQKTLDAYGRLDVLIDSATWSANCMLEDVDMREWDAAFQTNVHGPLLLARSCLPHFRPAPAIVFVGSLAGVVGYTRKSAYSSCKCHHSNEHNGGLGRSVPAIRSPTGQLLDPIHGDQLDVPCQD